MPKPTSRTPDKPIIVDVDSSADFLDYPDIVYDNGHRPATGKQLDNLMDDEWRRAHGMAPLGEPPEPIDH